MALQDELERIAIEASAHGEVSGVLAAEPAGGSRVYLVSYGEPASEWLALADDGHPLTLREDVRDVASLVAMCELAGDVAGGGDLPSLRAHLAELRAVEAPAGIDEAEQAAVALERVVGAPPRVASASFLDQVGTATLALERALGDLGSPFAAALRAGTGTVDQFVREVERGYKLPLR